MSPRTSVLVHFVHGTSRKTPCERAYLHGERNSVNIRDVTCPTCLDHPLGETALARAMERTLHGDNPAFAGPGLFGDQQP